MTKFYVAIVNKDPRDSYAHDDKEAVIEMTMADPGATIDVYQTRAADRSAARLTPIDKMKLVETITAEAEEGAEDEREIGAYKHQGSYFCEECAPTDAAGPLDNGGGASDTPRHCQGCHEFLENPLTAEGEEITQAMIDHADDAGREHSVALDVWAPFYAMEPSAVSEEDAEDDDEEFTDLPDPVALLGGQRFTLDGEPVAIADFIDDNREMLTKADIRSINALKVGESIRYGGGAAPIFTLKREA